MKKNIFGQILQFLGLLFLVCGIVAFFFSDSIISELGIVGLPISYILIIIFIVAIFLFILFYSLGTIICLLAEIEYNTRKPRNIKEKISINKNEASEQAISKKEEKISNKPNRIVTIVAVTLWIAAIVFIVVYIIKNV